MKNKTQTQELSLFGSDGEALFDFKPSTPKVAPQQPPKVFHPDKKITDFGEKIGGARKDRIAEMVDYLSLPDDELTNKVLTTTKSKLFNFNLKELASRGYNNEVLTFLWSAMHVAENKPRKNYGHFLKNWLDDTTSLYKRCLKAIREPEKKSSYLYNEHFPKDRDLCYGYEPVDEVYDTYMAIGGYKSGKDIGDARLFRSYSMNGEDNFWYLKGAGKYSDFFEEFDDAVNSLLDFANDRADRGINVNNTGKKKQRHVKLACWHSRTTDKYWIAPKDDKYIHLKEDIKSFNDGFKYIEDHQDELQALYNEKKPFGIPLTVWYREENPANFWIGPEKITGSIRKLYECARQHPDKIFKIAYRNTWKRSLNGYSGYEMIDMFNNAGVVPENIQFSKEWYDTGRLKGIKKSIEAKMKLNAMPVNHPSVPMTESRWHHDGEIKAREDMIPDEPHSFLGPQGIHGQSNSIDKEENLHNRGGIKL